jgi:hypothetical protein
MLPDEVSNYLSEIEQVMKPGGRAMITFFLLNQESLKLMESGMSTIDFPCDFRVYRTKEKHTQSRYRYQEGFI